VQVPSHLAGQVQITGVTLIGSCTCNVVLSCLPFVRLNNQQPSSSPIATKTALADYSIDQVCALWESALPKFNCDVVRQNGIKGKILMTLSDDDFKELGLNRFQIMALREAINDACK